MTKQKITTRTSLKAIRQYVADDFELTITNSLAKVIRDAKRTNSMLWSASRIVITNPQIEISERGLRWYNALYTPVEVKTFEV